MKLNESPLVALFCLLTLFTGMCPVKTDVIYVRTGEMVALHCPEEDSHNLTWTSNTTQWRTLPSSMSSSEQNQMGILIHQTSFIIFNASAIHQGKYSCSLGDTIIESFRLVVYTAAFGDYMKETDYPNECHIQESCKLFCPDVDIPDENTPNITSNGIVWQKTGDSTRVSEEPYFFSSVADGDKGVYICTRSYLYQGQIYNKTFAVKLTVEPKATLQSAAILSPQDNEVFYVDLGSPLEVNCTAVLKNTSDNSVFWFSGNSRVEKNNSARVFYYPSKEYRVDQKIRKNVSLVFKNVLEEDLLKNFSCKLESSSKDASIHTITLARKVFHNRSYVPLAVSVVVTVLTMALTVVIYIKYKIPLTLFIRDTLGCHRNISDGKSYDAYLMCYKSDAGLDASEREWLEDVLEDRFGYNLCLNDRDVLPGQAAAQTVLDCVEQSRTVVLVPTSQDPGMESGLLSAIHEALVERQTRLVLIRTEATEDVKSGSLAEVLHLLSNAGHCVTWKRKYSEFTSPSFWKQLRYYLPPARHPQKIHLLRQFV